LPQPTLFLYGKEQITFVNIAILMNDGRWFNSPLITLFLSHPAAGMVSKIWPLHASIAIGESPTDKKPQIP
jgi:hypothetical protein